MEADEQHNRLRSDYFGEKFIFTRTCVLCAQNKNSDGVIAGRFLTARSIEACIHSFIALFSHSHPQ